MKNQAHPTSDTIEGADEDERKERLSKKHVMVTRSAGTVLGRKSGLKRQSFGEKHPRKDFMRQYL